ncbi:hypothetical protein NEDG_01644 [Nematocida displodere]|uniref:Actin n=1 Tax=Nematocida displodere TaxID=1805483 RepID=A0A177EIC3_9MICR|nr:hypothetical protein NEDG_01644 [Nematocida displodere]
MNTVGDSTVHITDIGHETYKAGYAGVEQPSVFEKRGAKTTEEALSHVLEYITDDSKDVPLINIEDPFMPRENRKKTFVHLMESSLCSGLLFINGAVADCFSYGKSTGLMVRFCGSGTQVVPVIDGYCLSGGLKSSCGGEALSAFAREQLVHKSKELKTNLLLPSVAIDEKKRVGLEQQPEYKEKPFYARLAPEEKHSYEMDVARCFKESVSFFGYCQPKYYEFSTGFTTRVFSERNLIPEKLFTLDSGAVERLDPFKQMPGVVGSMDLLEMIKAAIESVDLEYYDVLLGNVMVSGGGAMVAGVTERLQTELMKLFPNSRVKVSNDKREFGTFFGGSVLGSLGASTSLMITKEEYSESGSSALERKRVEWVK